MWTRALREERLQAMIDNPLKVEKIISGNFLQNREKYQGNYVNAIQEFLTLEEAHAIVTKLSTCTCCKCHQQKRPTELLVVEYPHSYCQEEKDCTCSCRHFSRWLCCAFGQPVTYDSKDA